VHIDGVEAAAGEVEHLAGVADDPDVVAAGAPDRVHGHGGSGRAPAPGAAGRVGLAPTDQATFADRPDLAGGTRPHALQVGAQREVGLGTAGQGTE